MPREAYTVSAGKIERTDNEAIVPLTLSVREGYTGSYMVDPESVGIQAFAMKPTWTFPRRS